MSQFDFPRINFHGRAVMDVGTANNGYYAPLEIWDPALSEPVVPPAIQLTAEQAASFVSKGIIPQGSLNASTNRVLILPVASDEQFLEWVVAPLGSLSIDAAYHALYEAVNRTNEGTPLTGAVPGYWNYYGDMSIAFQDVAVSGIVALDSDGAPQTFTGTNASACPSDLASLLSATLTLENIPGNAGTNTGIMADINAEGESVTQLFCDKLTLYDGSETFFSGKPIKGVTRWIHIPQLVNAEPGPEFGAAACFWAIPADALANDGILSVFLDHYKGTDEVVGVLVRFALHRIFEVRDPDYAVIGAETNPALSEVTGTISPWCASDMHSITMGRLLTPCGKPFTLNPDVPEHLGQTVLRIDEGLVSMDVLTSMLELITVPPVRRATTRSSTPPVCEMADLGAFELQAQMSGSTVALARFGADAYDEAAFMAQGGIIDLALSGSVSADSLADATLQLYSGKQSGLVLKETPIFLASDQNGLYTELGDTSGLFMYDGLPKVPCSVRIYERGAPMTTVRPFHIQQLVMTPEPPATGPYINEAFPYQTKPTHLHDGAIVQHVFDTGTPGCFVYVFVPPSGTLLKTVDEFLANPAGYFFITVRVLNAEDYGKYLDESRADYVPPTWDVVYDEILRLYALIYPAMGRILPFTEQNWANGTMAGMLASRIKEDVWGSSQYMPRTRDMSDAQRQLLMAWAAQYGVRAPASAPKETTPPPHLAAAHKPSAATTSFRLKR